MKKLLQVLIFVFSSSCFWAQKNSTPQFINGYELINAMHKKYEGKWYRYFTFSQNMEYYRNDSLIKKDVWHEAASMPGNLLIKFEEKNSKNGVLFSDFKLYSFKNGEPYKSFPMVHDLLLVGLDVYFYKPEFTCHILDSLGYNLNKIRMDEFEGRKVYVVGADKGDLNGKQFWIDAERLYMHRIIYTQKSNTNDVVFSDYEKTGNSWVAKTILFKQNGKLNLIEKYYNIKFPKQLNQEYFKPDKFYQLNLE